MRQLDIFFVGPLGNTHIASSFHRAACSNGRSSELISTQAAYAGPAYLRTVLWRFFGRRPIRLRAFSIDTLKAVEARSPHLLITMGSAPLEASVIRAMRHLGVRCINFSTDDPFNTAHRASWHLKSLIEYDVVFTPRYSNIHELRRLSCREVHYLPFGYDEGLFLPFQDKVDSASDAIGDVVFVGGADVDRVNFFSQFTRDGLRPVLVGGYWEQHKLDADRYGALPHQKVAEITSKAAVNVCLVRRANRDGHVMRSFEIPAVGGFMLAENTEDHRRFFGPEGECVLYFCTPQEALEKTRWALNHPEHRQRMARACHERICNGHHTYQDRLDQMLKIAGV